MFRIWPFSWLKRITQDDEEGRQARRNAARFVAVTVGTAVASGVVDDAPAAVRTIAVLVAGGGAVSGSRPPKPHE